MTTARPTGSHPLPRRRGKALVAIAVSTATVLAACSSGDTAASNSLERAKEQGTVKVAVGSALPNSILQPDGSVAGIEPDVTKAVLERMGIPEIDGVQVDYSAMIPGLQADRYTIVAGALYNNVSRCEAVAFSEPVVAGTYAFLHKKDLANPPATLKELAADPKLKIVLISGSLQLTTAQEAGIDDGRILQVTDVRNEIDAMKQGRADIVIDNMASLQAVIADKETDLELSQSVPDMPLTGGGIIFRKEDTAFRDAFDIELKKFKEDGSYAEISKKYGVDPAPALKATSAELCKNPG